MLLRQTCFSCGKKIPSVLFQSRRFKKPASHWTNIENNNFPRFKALEHFDDFYKTIYGVSLWRSMRLGLLCNNKYCAVVNNYSDPVEVMESLERRGALNMRRLFEMQFKEQMLNNKELNAEKLSENVKNMQENIDTVISSKQEIDLLSGTFSRYEKAPSDEEARVLAEKLKPEKVEVQHESLSLTESMKNAHIDERRIIHPKNNLSMATLYDYVPATQVKGFDTWISEAEHYEFYKKNMDFPIKIEEEDYLSFPKHLQVYTYEKCNVSSFPRPMPGSSGVLDFYLLDGASVLPILALGLKKGDRVLDMCGAPGGKAITAFQTLLPDEVVCNDKSDSRVKRIEKVAKEYLFNTSKEKRFYVTQENALRMNKTNYYNKILVDVPCTNDRVSVNDDDTNYFAPNRTKERLMLPELQAEILSNALKLVAPGGTVIYCTCSLSPVQNDGVVQMALKKVWLEENFKIVVKDMTKAFRPANIVFYMGVNVGMKYGTLVLPHLTANFGPLYFAKLEKLSSP